MIFERVSLSGAWRETDSVSCKPSSERRRMPGTSPQVEREMCRIPMFMLSGGFTSSRKRITASKLSSGSPMPISTMFEIVSPESSCENSTWSSSSAGVSRRTRPPSVDAQNLHPIGQPTSDEMHTVFPW